MRHSKVKVGIVGCGNISGVYFSGCAKFPILDVVACADLDMAKAKAKGKEFNVAKVLTTAELLKDDEVEIVLNLTVPRAHGEVALAALQAGKSVYNEKPLAVTREEGRSMLQIAKRKKLLVGGAPDTFLGAAFQTCRKLIDDGRIGRPVAGAAFMQCRGHENWHPDPEFFYKVGGGPMFDMGPYYLTALVSLLGPVRRVTGSARITFPQRIITSKPKRGKKIKVEIPTHIAGVLDFANGAVVTLVTSFDVLVSDFHNIEIYGSEGSLKVPDPNRFGDPVYLWPAGGKEWKKVRFTHDYADQFRGLGVADMAYALRTGRRQRASGEMAYHVLDVMHAIHDASRTGKHVNLKSTCAQPAPLPTGLRHCILDD